MKTLLISLAISFGQMNALQSKPIVHLRPNTSKIEESFDGKKVQLINAPALVSLPPLPPKPAAAGYLWSVDIQNLGPRLVTVVGKPNISIDLNVNDSIHIYSNGTTYTQRR